MTTMIRAHFDGRVFVPDEPVDVPSGTPVTVQVSAQTQAATQPDERRAGESVFDWLDRNAIDDDDLPRDFAHQHEHYRYGTPKQPPLP